MKMKEFGPPGGMHIPGTPLGSANDLHNLFYLCFKNILPVQFSHPFLHSNSPEHTVFSFFSTHKLYTTLNNLHKITFTPYIVNQIDRT